MDAEERRATVDGTPMRWLERGQGPVVVLVHGIPTSPALWRHVLPLIGDARLLAWEMVGYGGSWDVGPHVEISVRAQAGHLHRWLDELRVDRAVLVGHDLGRGVCQIAAVNRPDRCAGSCCPTRSPTTRGRFRWCGHCSAFAAEPRGS